MEFRNHTFFPALAFQGVDQHTQRFHVVVLRQTYTWNDSGELIFAEKQAPICESDEYYGDHLQGGVRQESDLCHYKPRSDVIINATAYAPLPNWGERKRTVPPSRFDVRLRVFRPSQHVALPPEPQGLSPLMPASPEDIAKWRAAVTQAKSRQGPGTCVVDKTLRITGERSFVKRAWLIRAGSSFLKAGTLGMVRPSSWQLTAPEPLISLPLRMEMAFGGTCRIDAHSKLADRVPKKQRLTQEQISQYPGTAPPVALCALEANPIGRGFVTDWYLHATEIDRVSAPQVEYPDNPISLHNFNQMSTGKATQRSTLNTLVAGLGVRPKGHPERARLVGTIDRRFIESGDPLPKGFDFAVWNAAWPDQQIDTLQGDETIELTNLCAPESSGTQRDAQGNTRLSLALPRNPPYLIVRMEAGEVFPYPMKLDTLVAEPDTMCLTLVWRGVLAIDDEMPIRVVEAAMGSPTIMQSSTPEVEHG